MSESKKHIRGLAFSVARVVIEMQTPFAIGTGRGDGEVDAIFVTDANGLPCIPGTSLAGVLRHAVIESSPAGEVVANNLFGFQQRDKGRASSLEVSFGQVHGANDRPIPFIGAKVDDPVIRALRAGVVRDRVRIDDRGVADGNGKFDVRLVPAGARFTVELVLHEGDHGFDLDGIIALLPRLRLGRATRSGHGRLSVVRYQIAAFDLRKPADVERFRKLPVALHEPAPEAALGKAKTLTTPADSSRIVYALALEPNDHWMFGTGRPIRDAHKRTRGEGDAQTTEPVDRVPVSESRIEWPNNQGKVLPDQHYIPGSSLKGLLRHRVAFHVRRLSSQWAATDGRNPSPDAEDLPEIQWLFGYTKEKAARDEPAGAAGRVFVDDIPIPLEQQNSPKDGLFDHVSLDRFTQGPMNGLLFSEAPFYKGKFTARVELAPTPSANDDAVVTGRALQAFRLALGDLVEGRLSLGAGMNRGFGFARGELTSKIAPEWAPEKRGSK